jgi:hypothetical protein
VTLEAPVYDGLNIKWTVTDIDGKENLGVTVVPETTFFIQAESAMTITLNADDTALGGYLSGEIFGSSAAAFSIPNNKIFFDVNATADIIAPTIVDLRVQSSERITATIQATISEPGVVYYMYSRKGTKEPTVQDIISGNEIANKVPQTFANTQANNATKVAKLTLTGLTPNRWYVVYATGLDFAKNNGANVKTVFVKTMKAHNPASFRVYTNVISEADVVKAGCARALAVPNELLELIGDDPSKTLGRNLQTTEVYYEFALTMDTEH